MALFVVHPWAEFLAGMLTGCWIGVVIGCAVALLFAGKRVRELEAGNLLLRSRLRAREEPQKTGTGGPTLVVSPSRPTRSASKPLSRAASRH
jgi:hypothetical protein